MLDKTQLTVMAEIAGSAVCVDPAPMTGLGNVLIYQCF